MADVLITALATFGIAALVANYDGPYGIIARLRSKLTVAQCTVCLGVWVAIPLALFTDIGVLGYAAVIGIIILLERL